MPKIGGLEYTYVELSRMSGLARSSLLKRIKANPNITLAELIKPSKKHGRGNWRIVIVRGKEIPLYEWADLNCAKRVAVESRWNKGIRDPYALIRGLKGTATMPTITKEMVEWLEDTHFARRGSAKEWEIACELIGIHKNFAEQLKAYMEGLHDRKG